MTANSNDHTPGPWHVEADPDNKGKHPYHDTRFITTGYGDNWQWIATLSDHPNQAANARLIAAAPETAAERDQLRDINADLLAALEWAVARIIVANHEGDPIVSAWLPDARAAIEKARKGS